MRTGSVEIWKKTQPVGKEMDAEVFIFGQIWIFFSVNWMIEVFSLILYLDFTRKQLCFPPRNNINRLKESQYRVISIVLLELVVSYLTISLEFISPK